MAIFEYIAIDKNNKENKGSIQAENETRALYELELQNLIPISIREAYFERTPLNPLPRIAQKKNIGKTQINKKKAVRKKLSLNFQITAPKIPQKELILFVRQLSTLLEAGMPLVMSLKALERQAGPGMTKKIINEITTYIESGFTFSEALSKHPKIFDSLFISMIKAGETSGALGIILNRLATYLEKSAKIIRRIKSALIYPIVALFVAGGTTLFLVTFIVPKFENIAKDLLNGMPLPELTRIVMSISNFILGNYFLILAFLLLFFQGYKILNKTTRGRFLIDSGKYKLPIFGQLMIKNAISQYSRTLSTLLSSGVPILISIATVRETAKNILLKRAIQKVYTSIRDGENMATPMMTSTVFPIMAVSLVEVGEETGRLPEMLEKIADTYEDEVDQLTTAITALIEPLMTVFMGLLVGLIVVAMFLPLIKIMQNLGGV